ncbi:MAG: hypothetical protein BAJATHORv1_30330 [Candidatus Thorarchaeota archaeon]|nr:MAG: hypothetical protein BAJATHORv1_30330 [Candidatus Thorarchaeota archaeon]
MESEPNHVCHSEGYYIKYMVRGIEGYLIKTLQEQLYVLKNE